MKFHVLLFLSILPFWPTSRTRAQQPGSPTDLPTVIVTESVVREALTVPGVETAAARINTVAGGAAVVDAEDYKRGRSTTLKDALDFAPGVFIQPRFGAEESRVSMRGSGIQRTFHGRGIKLLQDGVPVNLADGSFDMQAIEPLSTRYIEVYRGGNALQYGATTLGGAINMVAHTGYDAAPMQARVEVGSFDSIRAQLSSGLVSGATDYYASLSHSSSDGFRDWSEQSSQRFFANLGHRISANLETRFYLTHVRTDSQLPGGLTRERFEANPQQAAPANLTGRQKRDFELFRLANKTVYTEGDHTVAMTAFWAWKDLDHPIFQVIDQLSHDVGVSLSYENKSPLLGHHNEFLIGFAPVYGVTQDQRFQNLGGRRGAKVADYELRALNLDLFLQDRFFITDTLSWIAGAQATYASRDLDEETLFGGAGPGLPNLIDNSGRQEFSALSPKLGLLWEALPEVQLFANVSRSFEPPSFGELVPFGSTLLELNAQTGTTFEIGTRGRHDRFVWDFAYYHSWQKHELLKTGVPGGPTTTTNAGRTVHQGIEFALDIDLLRGIARSPDAKGDAQPSDRLLLRQMYLWNDFRFDNDGGFGDNQLPGVPAHFYRAELLYEHPSGFYLGPNLEWVPDAYPVDLANTAEASGFALLGFKIGFRASKGLSVFVEAKNLTDESYVATTDVVKDARLLAPAARNFFFPGDGRAVYAGVEWKW